MDYVLRTDALCKSYRHFKVLNGLSMNIPKGAIYGFIGKNGAGKTTLIRKETHGQGDRQIQKADGGGGGDAFRLSGYDGGR